MPSVCCSRRPACACCSRGARTSTTRLPWRDAISATLDAGDLRAIGFHLRISVGILPLSEVRRFGDPELLFFNVNTADDLARADGLWRQHGSSP